jgi:hypothetical protein
MSISPATDHRNGADCWSEIRTRDHVMRYKRIGAGRPVLILQSSGGLDALCPALTRALTDGAFRLIVPELPDGVHLAGWLADFLEGIGAASVGVVATDRFSMAAIELALLGAEQIARVVLVADERGPFGRWCDAWQQADLQRAGRATRIPLLLIHREQPGEETSALVRTFLVGN